MTQTPEFLNITLFIDTPTNEIGETIHRLNLGYPTTEGHTGPDGDIAYETTAVIRGDKGHDELEKRLYSLMGLPLGEIPDKNILNDFEIGVFLPQRYDPEP